ncbi:MAG: hypothetical protein ACYCYF_03395 [Anaerolineae bacterium]
MPARSKTLCLLIVLTLLSLGCALIEGTPTPTDTPPAPPPTATDQPEAPSATSTARPTARPTALPTATTVPKGTELTIINDAGVDIWYLFVSPSDAEDWGDDRLGGDTIPAGDTYTLTGISDGVYDVQARDADDNPIQTIWSLTISGSTTQVIEEQALMLEVYNNSDAPIAELFVSPTDSDSWGEDQLGASIIAMEDTYTLDGLAPGTYDMQAEDASGNIIETIYSVSLDSYYYWNVMGKMDLPSNAVLRFEDAFENNRNSWGGTSSEGVVYNAPANGEFCINITTENLTAWEWYEPFRPDQFVAEVACKPQAGSGATCGLGFGADGDNLYWFEVAPDSQSYAVFLLLNDEWQDPLVSWTESKNIFPTGWNYMSIERVGGMFSVFINGVLQSSIESNYFPTGRIGLGGATYDQSNTLICLDNLRVWRME